MVKHHPEEHRHLGMPIEEVRRRIRRFVDERLIPLEADRANYDEHENIAPHVLTEMRRAAKAEGLWALQMPKRLGGMELPRIGMAALFRRAPLAMIISALPLRFAGNNERDGGIGGLPKYRNVHCALRRDYV